MANTPTEKKMVARCGIYDSRPQVCRDYPKLDQYMPEECTYYFIDGGERRGQCACNIGACCNIPRQNGDPGGAPLPSIAGGKPCKYLVWQEGKAPEEVEKVASTQAPRLDIYDLVGGQDDS